MAEKCVWVSSRELPVKCFAPPGTFGSVQPLYKGGGRIVLSTKGKISQGLKHVCLENISSEVLYTIGTFLTVHEYHGISVLSSRLRVRIGVDEYDFFAKQFFEKKQISRRLKLHPFEECIEYSHALYTAKRLWENVYNCCNVASLCLRSAATIQSIWKFESQVLAYKLPLQFLASVLVHDGQSGFHGHSLIGDGLFLLSLGSILDMYERLQAFGLQSTRLKNLSPKSATNRLGKSMNQYILPVCTGSSFDQRFLYIDLSDPNFPVGISSPLGMTRTLIHANWFSFLASLTP